MSAVDETFNPANLTRLDTSISGLNSNNAVKSLSAAPKAAKATSSYPRIDLESIYTDLKDAIGHKWDVYFDAVARFVRGDLHAREFGDLTDELLYASDNVLHLHNRFICAIAFNSTRDNPEPGIAAWVTAASEKSSAANNAKTAVTSDAGEQRLKKEVMAIHARDRRRLKNAQADTDPKTKEQDDSAFRRNPYEEAYSASRYKVPEVAAPNAAGLTKTNWEPEIKKRYQQPLFVESAEFPDATSILARMVPICYEEAIPQGSSLACAEFVVTGAEFFLKDFLANIFDRVRENGPNYDYMGNGHDGPFGGGVFTGKYRKQFERETEAVKNKTLQKTREDELLPVEYAASKSRKGLSLEDFKLADRVGPSMWNRMPLLGFEIQNNTTEMDFDTWKQEQDQKKSMQPNGFSGHQMDRVPSKNPDEMDVDEDEDDDDWDDAAYGGRSALDSLLDDCLAMPA